jgi:chromosome segregation ATPase
MYEANSAGAPTNVRSLEDAQRAGSGLHRNILAIPAKDMSNIRIFDAASAEDDVTDELERVYQAIESAAKTIGALNETISAYEMTIFDLTAQVAELSVQHNASSQQAANNELRVRAETDRAEAAEARAKAGEERIHNLELRQRATKERLGRVTTAVSNLVAVGDHQKCAPLALAS